MSEFPAEKWIYCNRCGNQTRHRFIASQQYSGEVEGGDYILWACAGCDTGTMEDCFTAAYHHSEEPESIFHPSRREGQRQRKYFVNLPPKLEELYKEVVDAQTSDLNVLCAIGLRGLIEGVCADKNVQGRNLDEKIEAMKALLPQNIVQTLHGFRFMGNRAAHELEAPNAGELNVAIDLVEDILNYLYDLDYKARMFAALKSAQRNNP